MKVYGPAYYEKNKSKFEEWSRASYERNRAEHNARSKVWRENNRDRMREFVTNWREANRDLFRKICREWVRNNKDKVHAQRARRQSAEGSFLQSDISEIMAQQKGRCAMPTCRVKLRPDFHVDHIIPIKRGGSNWRRNIQLLCPICNAKKGARDPIDHARCEGLLL